jgi:tripartite-type tricarboxylate transporter receptor subunit TctC
MGIAWANGPIKSIDDIRKRETVVGGTGFAASSAMVPRLLNLTAGTKFKLVTGYKGSGDITLAMERGEVEVVGGTGWASTKVNHPDWIKEKKIVILYQLAAERHRELPDVPTVADLALKPEDQAMLRFIGASADVGRFLIAPPGVPAERFAALRTAFDAMIADKDFLADMQKRNVDIDPMTGEKLAEMIAGLMKTPPDIVARARAALEVK